MRDNLQDRIREYKEYSRMIEEMEAIKAAIADELKAAMIEAGESKIIIGEHKLSCTSSTRETLDKKRLEADLGDLSAYTKITTYTRFAVA